MVDRPGSSARLAERRTSDDDVARLLREAGRRPAVPAPDLRVIREAFDAQWRESIAPRPAVWLRGPRLGLLLAAATLLALLSVALFWTNRQRPSAAALARVETVEGLATVSDRSGARGRPLRPAMSIGANEWLETPAAEPGSTTPGGRVGLRLAEATLRIDAGSRVRLRPAPRGAVIELSRGAVYVDAEQLGEQVEVRTPLGIVRDIGTQFEARLLPAATALQVRVRRGEVAVETPTASLTLRAGEGVELSASGGTTSFAVLAHGGDWSWILGLAPDFALEGRSGRELLEWVARETGWEVRYADTAAEAAAGTRFEGASTVRTPGEEALVWLRGAGLTARLEDGSIQVSAEAR